jgi:hypothetical protein
VRLTKLWFGRIAEWKHIRLAGTEVGFMNARFVCFLAFCGSLFAQSSQPSLTIYNQNFAVVRQEMPLDLKTGENQVNINDITMHLEPDSIILRDPSGKHTLQVLEQNYRADPVSQFSLLSLYEGRTIDFQLSDRTTVKGKVIRSGFVRGDSFNMDGSGQSSPGQEDPIIEVGGQLQFGLPGTPVFPDLTGETILKPRLEWLLATDKAGKFPAEFSYVTGGMTWQAAYNIVAPEKGDLVDIVGWVTMDNRTGKTFENARIKLMACRRSFRASGHRENLRRIPSLHAATHHDTPRPRDQTSGVHPRGGRYNQANLHL